MTKQTLKITKKLIEQVMTEHGDEMHNDRYAELFGSLQTINSLIVNSKEDK